MIEKAIKIPKICKELVRWPKNTRFVETVKDFLELSIKGIIFFENFGIILFAKVCPTKKSIESARIS